VLGCNWRSPSNALAFGQTLQSFERCELFVELAEIEAENRVAVRQRCVFLDWRRLGRSGDRCDIRVLEDGLSQQERFVKADCDDEEGECF